MHINVVTVAKLGGKIDLDNKYILKKICMKIQISNLLKELLIPKSFINFFIKHKKPRGYQL